MTAERPTVLLVGKSGTGRTHLATALGFAAAQGRADIIEVLREGEGHEWGCGPG